MASNSSILLISFQFILFFSTSFLAKFSSECSFVIYCVPLVILTPAKEPKPPNPAAANTAEPVKTPPAKRGVIVAIAAAVAPPIITPIKTLIISFLFFSGKNRIASAKFAANNPVNILLPI